MVYPSLQSMLVTVALVAAPFLFFFIGAQIGGIKFWPLMGDLGTSALRLAAAYLVSVTLAWILAVLFYQGLRAKVALPIFDVLQSFPTFAALPLAAFLLGPENIEGTIIFFLVITIMWPILFSIISSLKMMRNDWQEAAAIYNLKGKDYLRYFVIPVSLPGVITGTVIGLGEGWEALIATELIVKAQQGLGSFFGIYEHNVYMTAFGITGFLLLIFVFNKFVWLSLMDWSHQMMEE
jgi:ABC-type nitrate/sulfonate/bicarbonate transport system permease component